MLGILRLVIHVAIEVIGQESYGLHKGEHGRRQRQMAYLLLRQEHAGRTQIALGKSPVNIHLETYIIQTSVFFGRVVGRGAHKVAEIREHRSEEHTSELQSRQYL